MRPHNGSKTWRKTGRRAARQEPCYYPPELATERQRASALISEAENMAARQAHIDAAWDLPFLLAGVPGVTFVSLGEGPG